MTPHRASAQDRPLDTFEQSLLTELRHEVALRGQTPAPRRSRVRRRVAAAGASLGAALAVTLGLLLMRPDAAFAVVEKSNGDIVVTIASMKDAEGLEKALAEHGVDADVSYEADPSWFTTEPVPEGEGRASGGADGDGPRFETRTEEGDGPRLDTRTDDGAGTIEEGTPAPRDELPCGGIGVEMRDGGITFRLSAAAVASDSTLTIRTAGDTDDWAAVMVAWDDPQC
ncbi:hypothetical protein [Nocardioides daejeonensis]|uniref:hypothetical protein n=1 Tax=Nocardioides daejeonensis TaxID=1046556 RepID=UPI000D74BDE0|nr:hypothetical protein [Nocardioides daejeonensis]